jgi:hypothetical protein
MRDWRKPLREGLLPQLSSEVLDSLAGDIRRGAPELVHGYTVLPFHLDRDAERSCLVGRCAELRGARTVREVWKGFGELMRGIDELVGTNGSALVVHAWDWLSEADVRGQVLEEIEHEIGRREDARASVSAQHN